MEPILARKMWRTLEPYHAMIYFTPRATEAYSALGVPGHAGYFASRAAAMGAVSAEVVAATFYNFNPALVRSAIPSAWDAATPAQLVEARTAAADAALREMLGDAVVGSPEMAAAADTAREAALTCAPDGRPLFAGHAGLDWPDQPHLILWHAITLLREFRGDGHIAALVMAGVSGCEALVTHAAQADGLLPPEVLKLTRAWPEDEWAATTERLRSRGWLDQDDRLTAEGRAVRDRVEQQTDELALAPWAALGEERCDQLRAQVRVWSKAIVEQGGIGRIAPG